MASRPELVGQLVRLFVPDVPKIVFSALFFMNDILIFIYIVFYYKNYFTVLLYKFRFGAETRVGITLAKYVSRAKFISIFLYLLFFKILKRNKNPAD